MLGCSAHRMPRKATWLDLKFSSSISPVCNPWLEAECVESRPARLHRRHRHYPERGYHLNSFALITCVTVGQEEPESLSNVLLLQQIASWMLMVRGVNYFLEESMPHSNWPELHTLQHCKCLPMLVLSDQHIQIGWHCILFSECWIMECRVEVWQLHGVEVGLRQRRHLFRD